MRTVRASAGGVSPQGARGVGTMPEDGRVHRVLGVATPMSASHRPPQIDVPAQDAAPQRAPRVRAPSESPDVAASSLATRPGLLGWMSRAARWLPFARREAPAPRSREDRPPITDAAGRTP